MITIELVEKLRSYADISYEEAKEVLEKTNGDMLEAILELERQGKTKAPQDGGKFVTNKEQVSDKSYSKSKQEKESTLGEMVKRFFGWIKIMIKKGNVNLLVVSRYNQDVIRLPLTMLALLLILGFWVIIPIMIVGLFFNFKYYFEGPDIGTEKVNKVMDDVAKAAEDIKTDIKGDQKQ